MRAIDPITGVTQKQELFCQAIVDGMSQTQAYTTAYNADSMLRSTITRAASALVGDHYVATRIQQLKAAIDASVVEKRAWDRGLLVDKAEASYDGAMEAKQFSAANGALKLIGEAAGLLAPQSQATGGVTQVVVVLNHGAKNDGTTMVDTDEGAVDADDWLTLG